MPNLNGTGPRGEGPLTGRRLGKCADKESDKNEQTQPNKYGLGRGGRPRGLGGVRGFGIGRGRGSRRMGGNRF